MFKNSKYFILIILLFSISLIGANQSKSHCCRIDSQQSIEHNEHVCILNVSKFFQDAAEGRSLNEFTLKKQIISLFYQPDTNFLTKQRPYNYFDFNHGIRKLNKPFIYQNPPLII